MTHTHRFHSPKSPPACDDCVSPISATLWYLANRPEVQPLTTGNAAHRTGREARYLSVSTEQNQNQKSAAGLIPTHLSPCACLICHLKAGGFRRRWVVLGARWRWNDEMERR